MGKEQGEHKGKSDIPEEEKPEQKGPIYDLDVPGLAGGCGLPTKCAADTWLVDFAEMSEPGDGWQVMPDKAKDPDSTQSILNRPNKLSPFSLRPAADKSHDQEIVLTCEGKTCVVGKVVPSAVRAGMVELVSGPLLDALRDCCEGT
jgi:hypothetical protein